MLTTKSGAEEESDNEEKEESDDEEEWESDDEFEPEWSSSDSSSSSDDDMPSSPDDSNSEELAMDDMMSVEVGRDESALSSISEHLDEQDETADEAKTYSLLGDNFDKMVKRRFMRFGEGNMSFHWFISLAARDRIDLSKLADSLSPTCLPNPEKVAASLLPSFSDDAALKKNFAVFVSRTMATHIEFFSFGFNDVVQWHIPHKYSTEMSKKSVVVRYKI